MAGPVNEFGVSISGTTAQRPINAEIGARYFDTQTSSFLVWSGSEWVQVGQFDDNGNFVVENIAARIYATQAAADAVAFEEGVLAYVRETQSLQTGTQAAALGGLTIKGPNIDRHGVGSYRDNRYYFGLGTNPISTQAKAFPNVLYGHYFRCRELWQPNEIGVRLTTPDTATAVRLGIHNVNQATLEPTSLVYDAGEVATGMDTIGDKPRTMTGVTLLPDRYYRLDLVTNGECHFGSMSQDSSDILIQSFGLAATTDVAVGSYGEHTYGALPENFPAMSLIGSLPFALWLRKTV